MILVGVINVMPNAAQDDDGCHVNWQTSLQLSNGTLGVRVSTSAQKPAKRGSLVLERGEDG